MTLRQINPVEEELSPGFVYIDEDGELWAHDGDQFRYVTDTEAPSYELAWDDLTPERQGQVMTELSEAASAAVRTMLGLPVLDREAW